MTGVENLPSNILFSKEHEWVTEDAGIATIGVSDYAQSSLGDVVFFEAPEVGATVKEGEVAGVLESVKSASELYTPVTGEIIEVNTALESSPEMINSSPYDGGWLFKVRLSNELNKSELMTYDEYEKFLDNQDN